MAIRIVTAGEMRREQIQCTEDEWRSIRRYALPPGFRYLVSADQAVIGPVLLFLYARCVKSARVASVGNSQKAFCDDLYEWFSFLVVVGLAWDEVVFSDLTQYREALMSTPSPLTKRKYKLSTIRRRLQTISKFYRWAYRNRLCDDLFEADPEDVLEVACNAPARGNEEGKYKEFSDDDLIPREDGTDSVDAIGIEDLTKILGILGPVPQARVAPQTSVYRLAASLSVGTGMRLDEITNLTVLDILNLRPRGWQGSVPMLITKTKGMKPRRVFIPLPIYEDIKEYIAGERAECVLGRPKTLALFVNRSDSHRNPGRPLTNHTLWRNFRKAVLQAGLTYVEAIEWNGSQELITVARHHFHDLRHTYAAVMYQQLVRRGKSAPWLVLSRLLGHAHVSTTIKIYLRSVDGMEAEVSDALNDYMRRLRGG